MEISKCSFEAAHGLNTLMQTYTNDPAQIEAFFQYEPSMEGLDRAIASRKKNGVNRDVLVTSLLAQNEAYLNIDEVHQNIQKLKFDNTFTVTTGHQLSLASGPAFFFYKILNVIQLTQKLRTTHPNDQFIPVFWMASEDHDFEEISKTVLFGESFHWNEKYEGPVGAIDTAPVRKLIAEMCEKFGTQEVDAFCVTTLKEAYEKKTLSDAIRHIVYSFLGTYGVVVVDGDDQLLKKEMAAIVEQEIISSELSRAWQKQSASLQEQGFNQQLHIRDINVFYMQNDYRVRIKKVEQGFQTIDGKYKWAQTELRDEIHYHPERFSPNAALRPVYQEKILPNIAYIGGPGELSYWMQLKAGFDAVDVFFPALLLRNSVYFLDNGDQKKMEKYNLVFSDFFGDIHALEKRLAKTYSEEDADLKTEIETIQSSFQKVKEKAVAIDGSLEGKVKGMAANVENMVEGLEKRLVKAQKQNNELMLNQLHAVRDKILPHGEPQERVENFLSFYVKHGGQNIINYLIENLSVVEEEVIIIK